MPDPGQELSSIEFASMHGGPLRGVDNVQAQAAMSTVNFIKEVGFKAMDVPIRAVQDELPVGVDRLLGILEKAITSRHASAAPTTNATL